jgi:hypothetical protein
MTKLIMQISTKIGKNWIVSNQECSGSVKDNRHRFIHNANKSKFARIVKPTRKSY